MALNLPDSPQESEGDGGAESGSLEVARSAFRGASLLPWRCSPTGESCPKKRARRAGGSPALAGNPCPYPPLGET